MALGRPANKDTQNKVTVHTIGRHRYASVADREDTVRRFNLLEITFNDDDTVKSYTVNQKRLDAMLLTTGSGHGPKAARGVACSSA